MVETLHILKSPYQLFTTQNFILVNVVDGRETDIEKILSVVQSQIGRHGDDISIEIELPNSKDKVTSCFKRLLHAAKDLKTGISVHPSLNPRLKDLPSEGKEFDGKRQSGSQSNSEDVTTASENSRENSSPLVSREIVGAIDRRIGKHDHSADEKIMRNFSNLHVSKDPEKHLVQPTCLPLNISQTDGCNAVNGDPEYRLKPEDVTKVSSGNTVGNIARLPGNFRIRRVPIKVENLEK